ncbi:alpha-beta hydrolase superfamily lysophospholipase [Agromyces terreus]|uniref:Alpha-beta hydrolase superfamily lysophospholipase n=1 Tax=Agromyces terreus TaxID=424795 RepID=A0A9X2GYZ4_9MICO|nr:alpha/beta hydrolase [Agromyces terreus]MCP2370006.1 alpha-beta hydrolase superfamily lysophospholipase [Agromyces terreus]
MSEPSSSPTAARPQSTSADGWRPDLLGPGFEQLTLPLGTDEEGDVVATLVRYTPGFRWRLRRGAASGADVLYVHGWSDYFFNPEQARFWAEAGARFHALDLRKYGRSLRPGQTAGFVTDLAAYDADLEAALEAMGHGRGEASARPLILVGHSTGGLTLSLWASRNRGRASALVLNSPWLEFQLSQAGRQALAPVIGWGARVNPLGPMPNVDLGFYTRAVSTRFGGEWDYSPEWRPERGFTTHPAWLTAVLAGHAAVAAGIDVGSPALTLLSARSTLLPRWDEAMRTSDSVLVVDEIAERATRLGPDIAVSRIDGALHDVFLSREPARTAAYAAITRWLRGYAPGR